VIWRLYKLTVEGEGFRGEGEDAGDTPAFSVPPEEEVLPEIRIRTEG